MWPTSTILSPVNSLSSPDSPLSPTIVQSNTFLGFEPDFLSDIFSPKKALCDAKFELCIDHVLFVGHPTLVKPHQRMWSSSEGLSRFRAESSDESTVSDDDEKRRHLTMFNLVFAMQAQDPVDVHDCILAPVTAALKHEQLKRGYVKTQADLILSIREQCARTYSVDLR